MLMAMKRLSCSLNFETVSKALTGVKQHLVNLCSTLFFHVVQTKLLQLRKIHLMKQFKKSLTLSEQKDEVKDSCALFSAITNHMY